MSLSAQQLHEAFTTHRMVEQSDIKRVSFDAEKPAVEGSVNTNALSQRELDQLYWRAVYAERDRADMQQEVEEERAAARKRIGHLERENTKLRLLLKDSSTRLRSVRDMIDVQDREILTAIKTAGMGAGEGEDGELQKFHDAMKRIEGGHGGFRKDKKDKKDKDRLSHQPYQADAVVYVADAEVASMTTTGDAPEVAHAIPLESRPGSEEQAPTASEGDVMKEEDSNSSGAAEGRLGGVVARQAEPDRPAGVPQQSSCCIIA